MKHLFLLFSMILLLSSCEKDCYNAPQAIVFEFVDQSGINLMQNGSLTNFTIQEDTGNGNYMGIELTKTSEYRVVLERVGAFDGVKNYKFFSNIKTFDFSINSSKFTAGCEGFQIKSLVFKNVQVTEESGYYKIVLQ